jgi:hypothetical protein
MNFRPTSLLAQALVASVAVTFAGCSGGTAGAPGAPPIPAQIAAAAPAIAAAPATAASGQGSSRHRKPHCTTCVVSVTAVMSSTTPTIFNPVTLTVTFTNDTSLAGSGFGVGFNPLPTANGGPGVMTIAQMPNLQNGCTGSTVTGSAGQNSLQIAGVAVASGASCSITINLSASATGLYVLKNYTLVNGVNAERGAPLSWGDNDSDNFLTLVPAGDELYAPEPAGTTQTTSVSTGHAVAAGVQVFSVTTSALDCTIASSSLPDPTVVAVSPYNGTIYVYDHQNNTINLFAYQSGCKGGASLSLTPSATFNAQFPVAGMTVANNGNLVVSGDTSAYEMTSAGVQAGATIPSGGDVAAMGNQLLFESGGGPACNGTMGGCVQPVVNVTDYATNYTNSSVTLSCTANVTSLFSDTNNPGPYIFFHMSAAGGYVYLIEDSPYASTDEGNGVDPPNPTLTGSVQTNLILTEPCSSAASYADQFTGTYVVGTLVKNGNVYIEPSPGDFQPTSIAADPQTDRAAFGSIGFKGNSIQLHGVTLAGIEALAAGPSQLFPAQIPVGRVSNGLAFGW